MFGSKVNGTNKTIPGIEATEEIHVSCTRENKSVSQSVIKQIKYFEGTLKPYQEEGLIWMVVCHDYEYFSLRCFIHSV